MKIRVVAFIGAVSLFGITGCATMPSKQVISGLDYGQPLTVDYQDVIKKKFDRVAKDPVATLYDFSPPQQYWYKEPPLLGNKIIAGYAVKVRVNARNSLGGETGYQPYIFIFYNNAIIKVLTPDDIRTTANR